MGKQFVKVFEFWLNANNDRKICQVLLFIYFFYRVWLGVLAIDYDAMSKEMYEYVWDMV